MYASPTEEGFTSSAPSLKENFHGNLCSFPSRHLCLFLAQPQCLATHDGPCLHAVSTTYDQGEPDDNSADAADRRTGTQGVHREDAVKAGGHFPPPDMRKTESYERSHFPDRSGTVTLFIVAANNSKLFRQDNRLASCRITGISDT
jgi:hypothetical protein